MIDPIVVRLRAFHEPPPAPALSPLESIWRQACAEFLFACFRGASSARMNLLANQVFAARDALVEERGCLP